MTFTTNQFSYLLIQIPDQSKLVQIAKNKASNVTSKLGLIMEAMDGTAVANKCTLEASCTHANNLKGLLEDQ